MNIWRKVRGAATPGGDPCWECPVCGGGHHVMGIETQNNFTNICSNCGAIVFYDFQKVCYNCIAYNKENGNCIQSGDYVKDNIACKFYETFA